MARGWLVLAGAALVLCAGEAWAQGSYQGYGHGWNGGHMWFGAIWMLVSFVIFIAVIAAAVLLVRRLWHLGGTGGGARSQALETLDQRYARGEIEREEYLRRKQDLQG